MTGTTPAPQADAGEAPIATADADAKIEELLSVDPASLGIDMSDPKDADEEDGELSDAPKAEEQNENDEEDDDEVSEDEDDWDKTDEDDEDEADTAEPEGKGSKFVSDDGKVKLPDGRVTTIAALKEGALLQDDYSRKQAEVSQQAQQTQAMQQYLQSQYSQLEQQATVAMQMVSSLLPAEPDIRLAREDPVEYQQQKAEYDHIQGIMGQLMTQQNQLQEQQTLTTQQAEAASLGQEVEVFLQAEPALRDKGKWSKFREEVLKVGGEKYGMKTEDVGMITQSWQLRALTDAMRYHRLKAAKPKTQQKVQGAKPKPRKGSKRTSSAEKASSYRSSLTNALKQNGRKDVADRLLETLVD